MAQKYVLIQAKTIENHHFLPTANPLFLWITTLFFQFFLQPDTDDDDERCEAIYLPGSTPIPTSSATCLRFPTAEVRNCPAQTIETLAHVDCPASFSLDV
jgi:hypothetical protein